MPKKIKKIGFYLRPKDSAAVSWQVKIEKWLKIKHPQVKVVDKAFEALIVLGGDGTMLAAARLCQKHNAIMAGLNLGTIGFLASVRKKEDFLPALNKLLSGQYQITQRGMLEAQVFRNEKKVFAGQALNDIVITNPIGMVEIKTFIDGHPVQDIRGSGVLVATPTGSTAYNLSAHGPIVVPDARNIVLTELLDHDIPTPSIVLNDTQKIDLVIGKFRKREWLTMADTDKKADILLIADGEVIFPLIKNDKVKVTKAAFTARFVEFEPNHFLKSLKDKFSFK